MATERDQELGKLGELRELRELREEITRLTKLLNTPLYEDFIKAVKAEGAHQIWRWGKEHDENKEPQDWFWTIGYLTGKALRAHTDGDSRKALHHTISSAAVLMHWHQAIQRDRELQKRMKTDTKNRTTLHSFFRQHLQVPLTVGTVTGSIACVLTSIILGTNPESILLMTAISASSLAVPLLAAAATHCINRRENNRQRPTTSPIRRRNKTPRARSQRPNTKGRRNIHE